MSVKMCASPFVDTKQEDVEEGGTVKDAVPACGDEEDDDKRKCCIGCHRNARTGRCFVRPDEEAVAWAFPSGRGCWCRDCYNVWRLRFSQKMPLATMSYHLKQNTTVITEFEVALVSYISLRRNGSDRVNGPALAERMELVEWIAGAFGMPLGRFLVVPISDVVCLASPGFLVTIKNKFGFELGAMVVDENVAAHGGVEVARPGDPSGMQLVSRRVLNTNNITDTAKMGELFGVASVEPQATIVKTETDSSCKDMTKSGKKTHKRVMAAVSAAAILLHSFQGDEWEDMKERSFTKPMEKLMEAQLEAAHEQVDELIQDV
jgi:hypothetical protein